MDIINTKNTVNQILSSPEKKSERKDLTEIQIQQNINNFFLHSSRFNTILVESYV